MLAAIIFDIYLVHFKLLELAGQYMSLKHMLICIFPITLAVAWLFMKFRVALLDNGILYLFKNNGKQN